MLSRGHRLLPLSSLENMQGTMVKIKQHFVTTQSQRLVFSHAVTAEISMSLDKLGVLANYLLSTMFILEIKTHFAHNILETEYLRQLWSILGST